VVPVNAPGFVGPKNLGNKLGAEALLDYVIGTEEPEVTTPYDINIIGEYNLAGELWQIRPLLDAWASASCRASPATAATTRWPRATGPRRR
jgi:nitrogenase molybdenum-cofactor synthesis protein NifE